LLKGLSKQTLLDFFNKCKYLFNKYNLTGKNFLGFKISYFIDYIAQLNDTDETGFVKDLNTGEIHKVLINRMEEMINTGNFEET
jgi:hypothetical protein